MPSLCTLGRATAVALFACAGTSVAAAQQLTQAQFNAALAAAEVVGPAGQPELIIPMDAPGWAQALGVTGTFRHYKGLCGPDGAPATIEELIDHAERDLTGFGNRGNATQIAGNSPRFKISFDATNPTLVAFYLPDFIAAANYVDGQFNNRVTNNVSLAIADIPGDTIGSAGSTRYDIPWSIYVEGLRESSDREDDDFADNLPLASLPVRFGFPGTGITNVTTIRVTDAQLRAVFGDTAVPETESVSITFDTSNTWSFFGCGIPPTGSQSSLIDVAVHEITHSLGYTSAIADGGGNSGNRIQGLDVARFFRDALFGALPGIQGGEPITNGQFTTFERHGEFAILSGFSEHPYASTPNGFTTLLEQGDTNQPSHLARRDTFANKLGIMDPVIINGTTFCDNFYSQADIQPLDDMGWTWIIGNGAQDCNGNFLPDIIDIINGARDANGNNIPDSCENFRDDVATGPAFAGLTLSEWSAPGLQSLDGFNPNNFTLVSRGETNDTQLTHGSSADSVVRVSGFFNAPAAGEYAFRVDHDEAATLRVAGQTLLAINDRRAIDGFESSSIAPQNFINLEAGFHAFELTAILDSTGDNTRVIADSPALGGWRDLQQSDFVARLSDFPDCNSNGLDDQFDPDSDGDGTPDDCEADCDGDGVPDEDQFAGDLANAIDLGAIAQPTFSVTISTAGSSFDTEIALFNADTGSLIADDDDSGPGTQSEITRSLGLGTYLVGVSGFNSVYDNGPALQFIGCSASGVAELSVSSLLGSASDTASIDSGRSQWYLFSVVAPDCDGDGIPDDQEQDCDGNGVPDECEDLGSVGDAIDIGVVGEAGDININTIGSAFDTELGLWDSAGTLIATNDDIAPGNLQSELNVNLAEGVYFVSISGFNTIFGDGFDADTLTSGGCEAGGNYVLSIENADASGLLAPERVRFFSFEILPPSPCNLADLAEPFGLLDLADVNAFASAFISGDLAADLDVNGLLDLTDITTFVQLFTAGCGD